MSHEEKKQKEKIIRFTLRRNMYKGNNKSNSNNKINMNDMTILNEIFKLGAEKSGKDPTEVIKVDDDKTPYFIVVVGSPGVGKTSTITNFIENKYKNTENSFLYAKDYFQIPINERNDITKYDQFFHISLDFIVERIQPYRNNTMKAYKEIKGNNNKYELTSNNLKKLSGKYSVIQTKTNNFKPLGKRKIMTYPTSLSNEVDRVIEYGIKQRYNIIYDTTFSETKGGTFEKLDKVVNYLEKNQKKYPDKTKYKVIVILVTAPEEEEINNNGKLHKLSSEEVIKRRLKKRHSQMIAQEYIRAINPSLIKDYIEDNKKGFDNAEEYYKQCKKVDKPENYNCDDFLFREIKNKTINNNFNKFIDDVLKMKLNKKTNAAISSISNNLMAQSTSQSAAIELLTNTLSSMKLKNTKKRKYIVNNNDNEKRTENVQKTYRI